MGRTGSRDREVRTVAMNLLEHPVTFDTMNFKFADRTSSVVAKHVYRGTPLHEAWEDVVNAAKPAIGPQVMKVARALPIDRGLVTFTAEYAALLMRDNAGPAKKVNGLWFGLVELAHCGIDGESMWAPYISGSRKFNPKDHDWPCNPVWFVGDRWAENEPMVILSSLRKKYKQRSWYIDVCLVEPLHRLYVGHFARACPLPLLLGKKKSRGIGCGFDDGDLLTIGTVDSKGFKPRKTA